MLFVYQIDPNAYVGGVDGFYFTGFLIQYATQTLPSPTHQPWVNHIRIIANTEADLNGCPHTKPYVAMENFPVLL